MQSDILDILFEGKNKEYGAYELRKSYHKRMNIAIVLMFGICILVLIIVTISKTKIEMVRDVYIPDATFTDVNTKQPELPVEPKPVKKTPKPQATKFASFKITDDNKVKPDEMPPAQQDLNNTIISTFNQKGDTKEILLAPKDPGTGKAAIPALKSQPSEKEILSVEVQAKFPGGQEAWNKYLKRNLDAQTPANEGALAGNYTVTVSFLVSKDGSISEVKALNDPGYGCSAEAVRVIKKGPHWEPAVQNGQKVIYRQVQNITFRVNVE